MGRDPENSSYLIDLKFPCLQKLRLFGRNGDRRILEPFLKYGDFIAVDAAAKGGLPALSYPFRVLYGAGVLQHAAGCCAVGKEFSAVFFGSDSKTHSIFCHCNRRIADQSVKA
ncbi:hypothetical protein SDC9_99330 [bioreactor metagenome]|uniref:Uncharacterized protein n=1 Tax=bioreactor metagenome TaxID=1076179 RepID=A0A645AH96_9ZZZZ